VFFFKKIAETLVRKSFYSNSLAAALLFGANVYKHLAVALLIGIIVCCNSAEAVVFGANV
jgi:preprotein translocase subunit SecF